MAASSFEFRNNLVEGLYNDAMKGKGTDLEVKCPIRCEKKIDSLTAFNLHAVIVASSSGYFATFPDPKSRVLSDVDSETFALCVRFMYLGDCDGGLSHGNVASVLHASDILQIAALKKQCMNYLEDNLDHDNYEQMVALANQFNSPQLKVKALRFKTKNTAKTELVIKRADLYRQFRDAGIAEKQATEKKRDLQRQIDKTEMQWKEICQKEMEEVQFDMSATASEVSPWDNFSSLNPNFMESGAAGHLVYAGDYDDYQDYSGSNTYDPNNDEGCHEEGADSEEDSYGIYIAGSTTKPPAPSKEEYEKYGILHSHSSFEKAIKAAKPGDRIYLTEGVHHIEDKSEICIDHAHEFIGMGEPGEVIVEIEYNSNNPFLLVSSSAGFFNITFRVESCNRENKYNITHDAIIEFEEYLSTEKYDEPLKSELFVVNCCFELGLDRNTAYPTRVSGLFVKKGKSVTVEGCTFSGGAGNAIAVISDPYLYTEEVRIIKNTFIHNGQPSIPNESADLSAVGVGGKYQCDIKPTPYDGVPLGPASLELWKFARKPFNVRAIGRCEQERIVSVTMEENLFVSNLRAPFANRIIIPCRDNGISDATPNQYKSMAKISTFELVDKIADGRHLGEVVKGFKLTLKQNKMRDNGLQFSRADILNLRGPAQTATKLSKLDESKGGEAAAFPDGNSLLLIHHFLSDYSHGFPENWEYGEPEVNFRSEYLSYIPRSTSPTSDLLDPYGYERSDSESESDDMFDHDLYGNGRSDSDDECADLYDDDDGNY